MEHSRAQFPGYWIINKSAPIRDLGPSAQPPFREAEHQHRYTAVGCLPTQPYVANLMKLVDLIRLCEGDMFYPYGKGLTSPSTNGLYQRYCRRNTTFTPARMYRQYG